MTQVTQHTYTATLDDATVLSAIGGEVTFDAGSVPYVQASLTLAVEDAALLDDLDPRDSRRVTIGASVNTGGSRSFDLGIRSSSPDRADGTVALTLASDETILQDFAQMDDDLTPLSHQDSLVDIVDYVLDTVIPGTALGPGLDAPVPALAASSNLIRNPRAGVNTTDWYATWSTGGLTPLRQASGGPAYAPTYVAFLSNAGVLTNGAEMFIGNDAVSIAAGKQHVLSVSLSGTGGRELILDAVCFDSSGNITGFIPPVTATMIAGGVWQRVVSAPFEAYPNTANIRVRVRAAVLAGAEYVNVTAWRLSEATGDLTADGLYYDGGTTDTPEYEYTWQQDAHASISHRKVLIDAATPEALTWRAGVSAMEFLHPLLLAAGLRLVCDEQRHWSLRGEEYRAAGEQAWRYGVNITAADESLSRDDDSWFDAAVYVYRWTDASGMEKTRKDSFALTLPPTKVLRREIRTPYPGPGRAEHIVRRAQGKGRTVTVSGIPSWAEQTDQPLQITLDGTPIQTGISSRVRFDLDTDTVTVTSRTTDTPADAWDLIPAGEKWTDSPIGGSWIGEVI